MRGRCGQRRLLGHGLLGLGTLACRWLGRRWLGRAPLGALATAILLLTAGAGRFDAAQPDGHGAITLGILRRDGILVPFAAYDGRHWRNPWPPAGASIDLPIKLEDTPKGWWPDKQPVMDWRLFPINRPPAAGSAAPPSPGAPQAVHVTGINWYRGGCQRAVGLLTDYKPATFPPPPRVHPYPKDALAYSGDVTLAPIEIVGPSSPIVSELEKRLPKIVSPKENKIVNNFTSRRWYHSYTEAERDEVPVKVDALYRVPRAAGGDLYYFEAVKRYDLPKPADRSKGDLLKPACDLVTFAAGWFATTQDKPPIDLDARVIVTSCDYANVSFMLPLATMMVGEQPLVVVQWSSAAVESYMVMMPQPGRTQSVEMQPLIETPGGACGSEE